VSPTPLTALMEGRRFDEPGFTDGKDLLKLEAHKHASDKAPQDRSSCCGTMQLPEYLMGDPKRLEAGESISQEELLGTERAELQKSFH